MFLGIDPVYFLFALPGMALSMWASWRVKSAFKKYSRIRTARGLTGAQAAREMLNRVGLYDVKVGLSRGFLSDHYNPATRSLGLSEQVYHSDSISAVGVATHEAGHAIQHAQSYGPLKLRSALVPTVGIGSNIGMWVMMIGLFIGATQMVAIGALLFSAVVAFQLVTLPVEFDATARAKRLVVEQGIIAPEERRGMDKVLNAAALTYVAAALSSLLTLLYFLMRAGLLGGGRDR